jgi:hypothetical protein
MLNFTSRDFPGGDFVLKASGGELLFVHKAFLQVHSQAFRGDNDRALPISPVFILIAFQICPACHLNLLTQAPIDSRNSD